MVYTRRPRRRAYRRRGPKVSGTTRAIAVKALKTARTVKKETKPELLYKEISLADVPTTTGTLTRLNEIDQGDTHLTRQGDQIRCKYFKFKMTLTKDPDNATSDPTRVMFFLEKKPVVIGTAPTKGHLTFSNTPTSMPNELYKDRFQILYDKTFVIDPNHYTKYINKTIPLKCISKYTDGTGTNCERNVLWMYVISTLVAANATAVLMEGVFKYTDV